MATAASLRLSINAKGATAGAARFQAAAAKVRGSAKAAGGAVRSMFLGMGAFVAVGRAVKNIGKFQLSMRYVEGVARATGDELEMLREKARMLGATTIYTATQAAEGFLSLSRAGFTASESMAAIESTLNLATVGAIELGQSSEFVASSLRQFSLNASEAERVADNFTIASNSTNTTVGEMAEAMKMVGAIAGTLGQSIEMTSAAIGTLGNRGIKATMAGTTLRGTLAGLLRTTHRSRKAFERLGINIAEVNPVTQSMVDIFKRLNQAGMTAADAVTIFGRRNSAAALILANSTEEFEKQTEAQKLYAGETKRIAEMIENSIYGSWKALISAFDELTLKAGDAGAAGAMRNFLDVLTSTFRILAGMPDKVERFKVQAQRLADTITFLWKAFKIWVGIKVAVWLFGLTRAILGATLASMAFTLAWGKLIAVLTVPIAAGGFAVWISTQTKKGSRFMNEFVIDVKKAWEDMKTASIIVWQAITQAFHTGIEKIREAWNGLVAVWSSTLYAMSNLPTLGHLEETAKKLDADIAKMDRTLSGKIPTSKFDDYLAVLDKFQRSMGISSKEVQDKFNAMRDVISGSGAVMDPKELDAAARSLEAFAKAAVKDQDQGAMLAGQELAEAFGEGLETGYASLDQKLAAQRALFWIAQGNLDRQLEGMNAQFDRKLARLKRAGGQTYAGTFGETVEGSRPDEAALAAIRDLIAQAQAMMGLAAATDDLAGSSTEAATATAAMRKQISDLFAGLDTTALDKLREDLEEQANAYESKWAPGSTIHEGMINFWRDFRDHGEDAAVQVGDVLATAFGSLENEMTSAIMGAKTFREAFHDMSQAIIAELIKIAMRMMIIAMIKQIFGLGGLFGLGSGGGVSASDLSGLTPNELSNPVGPMRHGGIASGPKTGYLAQLHGTEAVIPLDHGVSRGSALGGGGASEIHYHQHTFNINAMDSKTVDQQVIGSLTRNAEKFATASANEYARNPRLRGQFIGQNR